MIPGEHRVCQGELSLPQTVFATLRVWVPGQAVEGHAAVGWRRAMGGRRLHGVIRPELLICCSTSDVFSLPLRDRAAPYTSNIVLLIIDASRLSRTPSSLFPSMSRSLQNNVWSSTTVRYCFWVPMAAANRFRQASPANLFPRSGTFVRSGYHSHSLQTGFRCSPRLAPARCTSRKSIH